VKEAVENKCKTKELEWHLKEELGRNGGREQFA
jgi:hypothetical protein